MAGSWNAELPVVAVDEPARTFTCQLTDDLWAVTQQAPTLADGITITYHVPDLDTQGDPVAWPYVQVGQTLRLSSRLA